MKAKKDRTIRLARLVQKDIASGRVSKNTQRSLRDACSLSERCGKVTPIMLRRMITMRNWLPENSRAALDAAIATARRKGVSPAQWDNIEVRELVPTAIAAIDGNGALSKFSRHSRQALIMKISPAILQGYIFPFKKTHFTQAFAKSRQKWRRICFGRAGC